MSLTLRTSPEDDQTIERLQKRWNVSKQAAIIRALRIADEGTALEQDALNIYEAVSEEYRDALDRLGSV